jgi:hypothetical protein
LIAHQRDHSLGDAFAVSSIYTINAWISIAAVFVIFTGFGIFVRYVESKLKFRANCNVAEIVWKMTRLQLMQSQEIEYRLSAGILE